MNPALTYERPHSAARQGAGVFRPLSPRERQVLELIALGWRITQIAEKFGCSRRFVANCRDNVLRKLDLNDNRDLVQYAWRNGVVS